MGGRIIDGRYELVRLLGQGGMGAVHEAIERPSSRRVALKLIVSEALANEPDIVARFEREAQASAAIDSPHVVEVLASGVDPATNDAYMVMELLAGEDLHALLHRLGPLAPDLVLALIRQACSGLERAHRSGVIHRDLKPANMFLVKRDGEDARVLKLLDFRIAKVRRDALSATDTTSHALTRSGTMLGSPVYTSPEQAKSAKDLDARADIFSLGVAMYELQLTRLGAASKPALNERTKARHLVHSSLGGTSGRARPRARRRRSARSRARGRAPRRLSCSERSSSDPRPSRAILRSPCFADQRRSTSFTSIMVSSR
ncbi:MAG: serine/threonine protein kinase [Labilithrix sp.]|nr:serine/threonine protein kinase [Labilithrix sp.]MCW5813096.1 serine/threonine protein kinase [Labilithrix sp.]